MVVVWTPAIAVIVGGHLTELVSWRASFVFLFFLGFILLGICFFILPETNQNKSESYKIKSVIKIYFNYFTVPQFIFPVVGLAFLTSGMFAYFSTTFFLYISVWKISVSVVSYFSLLIIGGSFVGRYLSVFVFKHFSFKKKLVVCYIFSISGCLLMLFANLLYDNYLCVLLPMIFYTVGMGCLLPNIRAKAFTYAGNHAGLASSIVGVIFTFFGIIVSAIMSNFHPSTPIPMVCVLLFLATTSCVIVLFSVKLG